MGNKKFLFYDGLQRNKKSSTSTRVTTAATTSTAAAGAGAASCSLSKAIKKLKVMSCDIEEFFFP